jgi:protein HOOK3
LYQERVHELELSTNRPTHRRKNTEAEPIKRPPPPGDGEISPLPESIQEYNDDELEAQGLGEELDDAISGTTMTDLKIQVRKLTRELESMKKVEADASKLLVLENLLEDANRMKSRYEADYLAAHREKLVLQRDIEEIRSGKSMGDG